ncbi:WYL domain-containing protein [Cryobacterium sp. TMT1-21]|uniref:WYL domain-containing protein n=1 Tax=Cryobacterium shii TaxID=1259235 RepID=A0AAQ2C482_9MICO|nr:MULTISPECIES: WYL domain-containing protein [Cryobacterium]TFC42001.1 WYL domain-containing protein [Cryobacterium shii]TFC81948.1 WYL domain-containing protein [Cryobacterium sp. TmT2-59]TFD09561.1 WYL domain-containing protein [Cryobacterium sp. TMT1-21]TFD18371.1 WYL domain-containing protein [Cryobacterium sp. TMT2-23]TFD18421.1 WYL domain-containing protein [Cryobacterium sp. TMT4-10]
MSALVMPGASDKLTFLLSLVPYLMDRDSISVTDVADHFGVAPQLVRDAVSLIAVSGVPGESRQYQHGDLFDIHWEEFETNDTIALTHLVAIDDSPRFSAREAAALIAGLQYLSSLPENADSEAIASLMAKLTRSASAAPTQVAVARTDSGTAITIIQSAVRDGVQVEFDYLNARGTQEKRRVDPWRVESVDRDWYLRGWCHLRGAIRTFRLDRMSDLQTTTLPTTPRPDDVVLPENLFEGSASDLDVVVELPISAVPLLADFSPQRAETDSGLPAEQVRLTVRVAHYHGLKRLVSGLAGVVTVVGPAEARKAVRDWAGAGVQAYDEAPDWATGDDNAPPVGGIR